MCACQFVHQLPVFPRKVRIKVAAVIIYIYPMKFIYFDIFSDFIFWGHLILVPYLYRLGFLVQLLLDLHMHILLCVCVSSLSLFYILFCLFGFLFFFLVQVVF